MKKRYGVGIKGTRGRMYFYIKADGTIQNADYNYRGYASKENAQRALDRVTVGGAALLQVMEMV